MGMYFRYRVTGTVSGEVEVRLDEADSLDANDLVENGIESGDVSVDSYSADLELLEGPPGFEDVEAIVGRDQAIEVYQTLNNAGLTVS